MPRRPRGSVPALQHHKPSGRARVTINGRDHWLGKWGSTEAQNEYQRLIAEFIANGRILPAAATAVQVHAHNPGTPGPAAPPTAEPIPGGLTVVEVVTMYLEDGRISSKGPDGKFTSAYHSALQAARALRPFDDTAAAAFGPKKLGMIRDAEAASGRSRVGCNDLITFIRRVFKWAESQELVPRGTHNSLTTVEPLRRGRTTAPELPPVKPVGDEVVDMTLPYLPEIVADMVRLQRLTGARPGEVCRLRPMDIDRSGGDWKWVPPQHKNSWRDADRVIMIGPRARKLLERYLLRDSAAYCFSPVEAERKRSRLRRLARRSPMTPSQRARKPKRNGQRRPRDCYDSASYRRAITRAVAALNADRKDKDPSSKPIEDWSPNQLRHAAATEIRKKFGLEAAQVVLGHTSADITQVYAERDQALAAEVVRQIG
jgi:integrase